MFGKRDANDGRRLGRRVADGVLATVLSVSMVAMFSMPFAGVLAQPAEAYADTGSTGGGTSAEVVPEPYVNYDVNGSLVDSMGHAKTHEYTDKEDPGNTSTGYGTDSDGVGYWWWKAVSKRYGGGFSTTIDKDIGSTYTIALRFSFDNTDGSWRKIIDYKNLGSDTGFYFTGSHLYFYAQGNTGKTYVANNEVVNIIVTRDGKTNQFNSYIVKTNDDGTQTITNEASTIDSSGQAIPVTVKGDDGSPNTILNMFCNDRDGRTESTFGGRFYSMKIWDTVITPEQASKQVTKVTFKDEDVTMADGLTYDGQAKNPVTQVVDSKSKEPLVAGTDYTVSYRDASGNPVEAPVEAGDYTAVIEGVSGGPYAGTAVEKKFTIGKGTAPAIALSHSIKSDGTNRAIVSVATIAKNAGTDVTGSVQFQLDGKDYESPVQLASDGTATIEIPLAEGDYTQHTITATYSGDGNYEPTSAEQAKEQEEAPHVVDTAKQDQPQLSVAQLPQEVTYGDAPFQLSTSGGEGAGAVTWYSSDPSVLSIDENGMATVHAAGPVAVWAVKAGEAAFNPATAQHVTLNIAKKQLTVDPSSVKITGRDYNGLNALDAGQLDRSALKVDGLVGDDVALLSSNDDLGFSGNYDSVAVAAKVPATATLTLKGDLAKNYTFASSGSGGAGTGASGETSADVGALTVKGLEAPINIAEQTAPISATDASTGKELSTEKENPTSYGESFKLDVSGGNTGEMPTYKSSDESVATVDADGRITIVGPGDATISVTKPGNESYKPTTVKFPVHAGKRRLAARSVALLQKTYDGSTDGSVDLSKLELDGMLDSDAAELAQSLEASGSFPSAEAGSYDGDATATLALTGSLAEKYCFVDADGAEVESVTVPATSARITAARSSSHDAGSSDLPEPDPTPVPAADTPAKGDAAAGQADGAATDQKADSPAKEEKRPGILLARVTSQGAIERVAWTRLADADGYEVYFAACNTKGHRHTPKKVKTVKGSAKSLVYKRAGLKRGVVYKWYVRAFTTEGGAKSYLARSKTLHAIAGNVTDGRANVRSVKVARAPQGLSLRAGGSARLDARLALVAGGEKPVSAKHCAPLRYLSSDASVARVSATGKVTARAAGTAKVYAIAPNGVWKGVAVTVK